MRRAAGVALLAAAVAGAFLLGVYVLMLAGIGPVAGPFLALLLIVVWALGAELVVRVGAAGWRRLRDRPRASVASRRWT